MGFYGNIGLLEQSKIKITGLTAPYSTNNLVNRKIDNINIGVSNQDEETLDNLEKDYPTANKEYKKLIDDKLVPWLKGNSSDFGSEKEIKSNLKIVEVSYNYHNYAAQYSPIGKEGKYGEFSIMFEPKTKTKLFDVVEMSFIVYNGKIYKISCTDV